MTASLAAAQTPPPVTPPPAPAAPHDHAAHQPPTPAPSDPHAGHGMALDPLPPFIPVLTDADRAAAFPPLGSHHMNDSAVNTFVLVDQFEWASGGGAGALGLDTSGWVGTDRDRLWFRVEGDRADGRFEQAQLQVFYGRAVSRWWTAMAGIRQDVRSSQPRTAAAFGVQGLAPLWIEVEASLYLEPSGRGHVRLELEHDVLLTNRLILQPLAELEIYSRVDRPLGIGRGLSTADLGLRLRYERRRELAPYVGVVWRRSFFGTADAARAEGRPEGRTQAVLGLRVWF